MRGRWLESGVSARTAGRAAVLLDRDGTIIHERHYLADPGGVELIPGAAEALRDLAGHGFALVVVTNQSGIARGLIRPDEYLAVERRLDELLAEHGVRLDATFHCPHHPEWSGPCDCRKPAPGLYLRAAESLGLELARSFYVGDKVGDVLPAKRFGGTGFLVRTGHGAKQASAAPEGVHVVDDLASAARRILAGSTGPATS